MAGLVDWGLGRRAATALAGAGDGTIDRSEAAAACDEGLERALAYSRLDPAGNLPPPEVVDRARWIELNIAELSELAAPLEARAAEEISLPGPLGRGVRGALGVAGGIEAGVVVGYAARRVLGQYQVSLGAEPRTPRLLLLGPNLAAAPAELAVDASGFLRWVAIHEQTHAVQFAAVPWLRDHLAEQLARLIETAGADVDLRALAGLARRLVTTDPRRTLREALRGELSRALAGPEQAATLDRIQATMAVVEGYAEHVMDAAAADDPGLASMRARLDERRARGGLADQIARALGLGMKLRQYELGKAWSDAVAAEAGIDGLNRAWESPAALPGLPELEQPLAWLDRVRSQAPAV